MQPYFLPYIGYFQLMAAVDRFVILDDVNYIKGGWINRNRLPARNGTMWLTLPLVGASPNRIIREIEILPDNGWKRAMERTVALTYAEATEAALVLPLFRQWLASASGNLSAFLSGCLVDVAKYLRMAPEIVYTSSIHPKDGLKGPERVLDICLREGASVYVNLPGGRELYDPSVFSCAGVELHFLQPQVQALALMHSGTEGPVLCYSRSDDAEFTQSTARRNEGFLPCRIVTATPKLASVKLLNVTRSRLMSKTVMFALRDNSALCLF